MKPSHVYADNEGKLWLWDGQQWRPYRPEWETWRGDLWLAGVITGCLMFGFAIGLALGIWLNK